MIAERTIIWVLLNSHYLNTVVTILDYTRQDILAELVICAHLLGIFAHSDVALIYEQRVLVWLERLLFPLILLLWSPNLSRENLCLLVLHHSISPCRYALALSTVPLNVHLEQVAVLHCFLREFQFPVACTLNALCLVFLVFLPVVEITNKIYLSCIRCPLAEYPSSACVAMKTIINIAVCKVVKSLLAVLRQLVYLPCSMVVTSTNSVFERFQIAVVLHETYMLRLFCFFLSHIDLFLILLLLLSYVLTCASLTSHLCLLTCSDVYK